MNYFLGVDLAAVEKRPTGICIMTERLACMTWTVHPDQAIVETAAYYRPRAVALDAPLSRPLKGGFRRCDRELRDVGVNVLPPGLDPMKKLTERGVNLARRLKLLGLTALETFPRGVRIFLGIPAWVRDRRELIERLKHLGLAGIPATASLHEVDAATCALMAYLWWIGLAQSYGGGREGVIMMPKPSVRTLLPLRPQVG